MAAEGMAVQLSGEKGEWVEKEVTVSATHS